MRIVENKAIVFATPTPEDVVEAVAKSAVVKDGNKKSLVAVHWDHQNAQTLVGMGYDSTPSPILKDYTWAGKFRPFEHQKTTASFLSIRDRAFCFNEQGTGKTASVIWAADYLMKLGKVKRVLVLCPLSIMKSAWQQDLFNFAMHRSCSVAHGSSTQRKKIINAGSDFVIINFDGLAIAEEEITAGGFDLIVVDEANAYKNAQTNRWKVLARIIRDTNPKLWMLTGTPAAQSPVDAYGLAKLVNPQGCPRHFGEFRANVMYKVTQFKWQPKAGSEQYVKDILQPAIRFEKADCLDLPDMTYMDREAPLTKQQQAYYDKLRREMTFEADGERITAVNAAVNINKLLQISGGAVYSDDKEVIEFDVKNRINTVIEVIEESANKVLVFVPFTHTIDLLKTALEKKNISCAVINGKVSPNRRSAIIDSFQKEERPEVLLIQPQAASHGLTLTAADTIIWYAPVTSVETYLQANARIDRPGQKHPMTVIHISGSPVEKRLYAMLRGNIKNHRKLIDLYKEEVGC